MPVPKKLGFRNILAKWRNVLARPAKAAIQGRYLPGIGPTSISLQGFFLRLKWYENEWVRWFHMGKSFVRKANRMSTRRNWLIGLVVGGVMVAFAGASAQAALINVALGKPASQSSTLGSSYTADKAVDNNLGTFSHTVGGADPNPWWQVNLGGNYMEPLNNSFFWCSWGFGPFRR